MSEKQKQPETFAKVKSENWLPQAVCALSMLENEELAGDSTYVAGRNCCNSITLRLMPT